MVADENMHLSNYWSIKAIVGNVHHLAFATYSFSNNKNIHKVWVTPFLTNFIMVNNCSNNKRSIQVLECRSKTIFLNGGRYQTKSSFVSGPK
jgi:hypothetical protein